MPKRNIKTTQASSPTSQTPSYIPTIGKHKQEKILSKSEADFNRKIKKIETLKKGLEEMKAKLETAKVRIAKEIHPLLIVVKEKQKKYIHLLDAAYHSGFFKKRDSETIIKHIIELCEYVLSNMEMIDEDKIAEDVEIETIQKKYESLLYTEEESEMIDQTAKEMIKSMFGIDIDLEQMKNNPHEYFEKKQAELEDEQQRMFEQAQSRNANRKKTAKQIEKEKKEEEAKKALNKDIRSIYTSLAKELHPDLEQDEEERNRKTELMKRVSAAYEANDLFELLKLQLEYQIQHERIDSLLDEQIKRYNQVLQQQINELEQEKFSIIGFGSPLAMIYHKFCLDPKMTDKAFKQEKDSLKHIIDSLQDSINTHTDYKVLKEFLKELRQEYKEREQQIDLSSIMRGW